MAYLGYMGDNTALVKTAYGFKMYCDTTDTAMTPHLCDGGEWEPWVSQYFLSQAPFKDKVFVDAGANIGYYSILFGYNKAKQVWAFEPIEGLCNLLKKSSAFNGKASGGTEFNIFNKALSNKKGMASFKLEEGNLGGSTIKDTGNLRVPTVTLDSYNIPQVDYMKIDVEGHEPEVLIGAAETIKRSKNPKIIMEWNEQYVDYDRLRGIWKALNLKPSLILKGAMTGKVGSFNPVKFGNVEDILLTKK